MDNDPLGILGDSDATKRLRTDIRCFASCRFPVLILGETGTGKELVARALHRLSKRKNAEPVAINCGAIPQHLIESELFGYEKGAHSTAHKRQLGKFEQAHGGSLFLDEIGELPRALQPAFLRALQERQFYRMGGEELVKVDVRVIAATHPALRDKVAAGEFRQDLWERLRILVVTTTPLRERPEDVPVIANAILAQMAEEIGHPGLVVRVSSEAMEVLQAQHWSGNVRELQGVLIRSVLLADRPDQEASTLTLELQHLVFDGDPPRSAPTPGRSLVDQLADLALTDLNAQVSPVNGFRPKDRQQGSIFREVLAALRLAIPRYCGDDDQRLKVKHLETLILRGSANSEFLLRTQIAELIREVVREGSAPVQESIAPPMVDDEETV